MESLEAEYKLAASLLLQGWPSAVTLGSSECPRVPLTPCSSRDQSLIFLQLLVLASGGCAMFCTEELDGSSPLKPASCQTGTLSLTH